MTTIWGREVTAIAAFVQALLTLAVTFGLGLSPEQIGAILTVTGLGLALLVRQNVYSTATVQKIADAATYLAPGSTADIGSPPDAIPPLPGDTP